MIWVILQYLQNLHGNWVIRCSIQILNKKGNDNSMNFKDCSIILAEELHSMTWEVCVSNVPIKMQSKCNFLKQAVLK